MAATKDKDCAIIHLTTLIDLHKIGFKLVPLTEDGKIPNVSGLLTAEEKERGMEESADGKEHPVNYIYHHPEFWNEERLTKESWRFHNVATTFGKTHFKDEQGNDLYLNKLDIDSKEVFTRLANIRNKDKEYFFIDEMCQKTYVTKTRKKWGRHIFWLSRKPHPPIGTKDCKLGHEFEVKTDNSLGLGTLPPSIHRDNPNFHYQGIGQNTISIQDGLYDGILSVLADCLKTKDEEKWSKKGNRFESKYRDNKTPIDFTDEEIQAICELIRPYYYEGCKSRHDIVFGLCGLCHKNNITQESAYNLVETLAKDDEEKKSRLLVLDETYKKDPKEVSGSKRILEILEHATGDDRIAKNIFQKLFHVITNKRDDEKIDYVILLTDEIMAEYAFKTMKDAEQVYYYNNDKGVYVEGGEWLIKEQCEILCPEIPTYKVQEVINHIKRRTGLERSRFDSDNPNVLNLQNGLLDIETGEVTEHSISIVD